MARKPTDKPCSIGVLCRAYKGGNPYQSSFTADTGTYRVCADKVVCKRVQEVKGVLLDNGKEKRIM